MKRKRRKIAIIGFLGTMGGIFYQALRKKAFFEITGVDRRDSSAQKKPCVERSDYVLLLLKPQDFQAFEREIAGTRISGVVISCMAGVSVQSISEALCTPKVARAMPNLPAQAGQGCSVWVAAREVTMSQKRDIGDILSSVGIAYEVTDERFVDMATAVSGSGPGYVFLFAQYFEEAAVGLGLPKKLAANLARQTFIGSAAMLQKEDASPEELRRRVTSCKGTTAAAIAVFQKHKLSFLFQKAVKAAYQRARELNDKR